MGIYNYILKINRNFKRKTAISMTMDNGEMKKYTYGNLFEKADEYAQKLINCGIRRGDRIIIAAENSAQWQIAFLAIMKIKATAVLLDASLGDEDLKHLIKKSDARCMYVSQKVKEKIGESAPFRIPVYDVLTGNAYKDSYKVLSPFVERTEDPDPEVALIIYSSGTTRSAAGIMHTHEAMIKTIRMTAEENELLRQDRILSLIPNSHIYGVVTCLLGSMMLGASVHYVESISNENILRAFKSYKPTIFPCVPKVFELFEKQVKGKIEAKDSTKRLYEYFYPVCLKVREETGIRLGKLIFRSVHKGFGGRLGLMTSAGAPLDEKVAEFYYAMGFDLLITYGLTETNIPLIGNRGENITLDTCGTPYPEIGVQLAQQDETGEGEIQVRSPFMMKGYFRDEEATRAAFTEDGWFKTGDLGKVDTEGNVKITGRSKENIVLATGKKVAPSDIESQYMEIKGIDELVISGVPISGEYDEVHAFVVKNTPHLDERHIRQAIQERGARLAQYMKIARVHFLEEIPKTSLQKPKRYLLKKHALEAGENQDEVVTGQKDLTSSADEKTEVLTSEQLQEQLCQLVIEISGLEKALVTAEGRLLSQIGIDSLAAIEVALKVEEKYQVNIQELLKEDSTITEIAEFIKVQENQMMDTKMPLVENPVKVNSKTFLHYAVFKASCILAHLLYRVKVTYKTELPQDNGYIICANHVSNIDYLWIAQSFSQERFAKLCCMAKKELFKDSWIVNLLRNVCGMIPVDREGMNCEIMQLCKKQLEDKWGLIIHPEGTRSHDGEMRTFKKGAASIAKDANVPIIPTYIKGGHQIFPRDRKLPRFFNFETRKRYEVEVIFGEPIYPGDYTADELIQKVEEAVRVLSNPNEDNQVLKSGSEVIKEADTKEILEAAEVKEDTEELLKAAEVKEDTEESLEAAEVKEDTEESLEAAEVEEDTKEPLETADIEEDTKESLETAGVKENTEENIPQGEIERVLNNLPEENAGEAEYLSKFVRTEEISQQDKEQALEGDVYTQEITLSELLECDYEIDLTAEEKLEEEA